jgi:hypothetical protein
MHCCGPLPISGAADRPDPARGARDAVGALLFAEVLKPVAAALGPIGDVAVESVVTQIVMRSQR